jgi:hypothetical protein
MEGIAPTLAPRVEKGNQNAHQLPFVNTAFAVPVCQLRCLFAGPCGEGALEAAQIPV